MEGDPLLARDRVLLVSDGPPAVVAVQDGAALDGEAHALQRALAAEGATRAAPGTTPGTVVGLRPGSPARLVLHDVSGPAPRVVGGAALAAGPGAAWWSAVSDGTGLLVRVLRVAIEPGHGFVAAMVPLDDGRLALVFAPQHHQTRVAVVTPGRADELSSGEVRAFAAPAWLEAG